MAQVNTAMAQRVLTHDDRTGYTLLVDPTIIEAEMTYLGVTGDRPVRATRKALGLDRLRLQSGQRHWGSSGDPATGRPAPAIRQTDRDRLGGCRVVYR